MYFVRRLLDYDYRQSTRLPRLIALGVFVHLVLFYGTMDVYFSTAVLRGLPSHGSDISLSKRVVVFVSDGLRAEGLFGKNAGLRTPFLTETRLTKGAWGVSHSRLPTESRPGHVAIFAGMYEDPHAITKGWKHNPIDFDHVFNQSKSSYLWGSPDVIPMFNKDNLEKIYSDYYEPSFEDFSGQQSTILLDDWVFKKVKLFLEHNESIKHQEKSIFFLHLLGMDTVGHVHKPNSKEYFENLIFVDEGVGEMVKTMDEFFNDGNTTYIFTSDHGMTDWGSHGSGSHHETEAPFVIWGANVKSNNTRQDLNQADITAIICGLLGINHPINSVGIFRSEFFNLSEKDKAEILYANTMTLVEQYLEGYNRLKRNLLMLLYKPIEDLVNIEDTIGLAVSVMKDGFYEEVIKELERIMDAIETGKAKNSEYLRMPMIMCLMFSLSLFMMYTCAMIVKMPTNFYKPVRMFEWNLFLVCCSIILIIISIIVTLYVYGVEIRNCFYIAFPLILMLCVVYESEQIRYFTTMIYTAQLKDIVFYTLLVGGVDVLGMTLIYRSYITFISIGIMMWMLITNMNQEGFFNSVLGVAVSIMLPMFYNVSYDFKTHNYIVATIALILAIYLLIFFTMKGVRSSHTTPNYFHRLIIAIQIVCLLLSWVNIVIVSTFTSISQWLMDYIYVSSWIIFVISLFLTVLHPRTLLQRSIGISMSLFNIYFLMSFNGESLFIIMFICVCLIWRLIEFRRIKANRDLTVPLAREFNSKYRVYIPRVGPEEYRRTFIYLSFILISFFGAGNISDLNTFDPMWARCFVKTFNPYLITVMIMFKLMIPFFMATAAFISINVFARVPIVETFSIILFYSDIMVLNTMLRVVNTGSWLEIGLSIARFLIASFLSVALLLIYTITSYLVENEWFDRLSARYHRWIGREVVMIGENKLLYLKHPDLSDEPLIPEGDWDWENPTFGLDASLSSISSASYTGEL